MQLIIALFFLLVSIIPARAAYFPLEITNIKPAGTGSPAIPSTNRIFRAYPGLEYNIRPAVIGGMYPFVYSLTDEPAGMTIDSATGEISWPNPSTDSGTITLSVTDAEDTTVTAEWAITVSTSGFVFLDADYSGTESGSITQPYSTLANLFAGVSDYTTIVYVKPGTYAMYEYMPYSAGNGDMLVGSDTGEPVTWIGYPGNASQPVFTGTSGAHLRSSSAIYIDDLKFNDFPQGTAIKGWGGHHYQTVRRCLFDNVTAPDATNNNYGFIYMTSGDTGYYTVIQDNELKNFTGASAIGSLYDTGKILIEDNYIHSTGGSGLSGINGGISAKYRNHQITVRKNRIIMASGYPFGRSSTNGGMENAVGQDISFNYFYNTSGDVTNEFQGESTESPFTGKTNFYFYRNTVVGRIQWTRLDGSDCPPGPINFNGNVVQHSNETVSELTLNSYFYYSTASAPTGWTCVTDSTNLKGTSGLVDSNGLLINRDYVGTYGWETGESVPPEPPSSGQAALNHTGSMSLNAGGSMTIQ